MLLKIAKKLSNSPSQAHWAVLSQVVTSAVNFVTTVLLIRVLGIEEFGKFSICFLLIMTVRNFELSMVLTPISTIGPKLRGSTLKAYRGFSVVQAVAFSGGSSILLAAAAFPLSHVLDLPWLPAVCLSVALANATAVLAEYVRRHHFVYGAPIRAFFVDLIRFTTQIAGLIILATWFPQYFSINSTLLVLALGGAAGTWFGVIGHGKIRWSSRLSSAVWARHWNFIKWLTPGTTLETIQSNIPILIAGAILGEAAIGIVRGMQQIANMLNLPTSALQQIIPSIAAKELHNNGLASMRHRLFRLTVAMSVAYGVLTLAVLLFYPIVSSYIFKEAGSGYALLFALFCLVNVLVGIRYSMQAYLVAMERPMYSTYSNALSATISVVSVIFLIQPLGVYFLPIMSIVVIIVTSSIYVYGIVVESRSYLVRHGK